MGKIVLLGTGRIRRTEAMTLLEDYVEGEVRKGQKVEFVFPLTSDRDENIPTITTHVYRWALMDRIPYRLVVPTLKDDRRTPLDTIIGEMMANADGDAIGADFPVRRAVKHLDSDTDVVIIAWDDDDHACAEAARLCHRLGITALDLTAQLEEIEWSEPDNDESDNEGKSGVLALATTVAEPEEDGTVELPAELVDHLMGLVDALADLVLQRVVEKINE